MNAEERYESWKRRRAEVPVPEEFADRVMAALKGLPRPGYPSASWRRLVVWFSPRASKVGLCALAGLALAYRMLNLIALFIPQ
jgi:hypothetical protein